MKTTAHLIIVTVFMAATQSSPGQPSITGQPANQTANQGFGASFRAVAQGTAPLNDRWFFQSNAIPSATTNVLTIANAQPMNDGSYFVVVTNSTGSVTSRVATLTVILPVPLDPKRSANIRVGEDLPELPVTRPHQAEPHIARSYLDPNLLIATFQDGHGTIGGEPQACGYAVSADGGLTWKRALIPELTKLNGREYPFAAGNVAALDLQGNLFAASLTFSNKTGGGYVSAMTINKSVDASKTLGTPRVAAQAVLDRLRAGTTTGGALRVPGQPAALGGRARSSVGASPTASGCIGPFLGVLASLAGAGSQHSPAGMPALPGELDAALRAPWVSRFSIDAPGPCD